MAMKDIVVMQPETLLTQCLSTFMQIYKINNNFKEIISLYNINSLSSFTKELLKKSTQ